MRDEGWGTRDEGRGGRKTHCGGVFFFTYTQYRIQADSPSRSYPYPLLQQHSLSIWDFLLFIKYPPASRPDAPAPPRPYLFINEYIPQIESPDPTPIQLTMANPSTTLSRTTNAPSVSPKNLRVQTLSELTNLYGKQDRFSHLYWVWDFYPKNWPIGQPHLKKKIDRINVCLPDLPRIPTDGELKFLTSIFYAFNSKIKQGDNLWFFDNSIKNLTFRYNGWGRHNAINAQQGWTEDIPYNNTYTIRNSNGVLYYETNGVGLIRHNYRPSSVGRRLMEDLDRKMWETVHCHIRDTLIRAWCSVPYKKGTRHKTVLKNLFSHLSEEQKPTPQQQALFIETALQILEEQKKEDAEYKETLPQRRIQQRKEIQQRATDAVERRIRHQQWKQQIEENKEALSERKLQELKQKYEEELKNFQGLQKKHEEVRSKRTQSLDDSYHARAATLLSGVCKSLNLHYTNKFGTEITKNPFTNISNDTFLIVDSLLNTTKNS